MHVKITARNLFIGALFTLCLFPNFAAASLIDIEVTSGIWSISATDDSGLTWDESTLIFETQTVSGNNIPLTGYFHWIGSNGAFGRENFTGTLFADRSLELFGFEIVQPAVGIITANYFGILTALGNEIVNGSWDGSGIPSDDWSATLQAIPLPSALWLIISGAIGISVFARKRSIT